MGDNIATLWLGDVSIMSSQWWLAVKVAFIEVPTVGVQMGTYS